MATPRPVRRCPDCGAEAPDGAPLCPRCRRFVPGGAPAIYESRFLRELVSILWFLGWPFSMILGVPREAKKEVTWKHLLAVAIGLVVVGLLAAAVVLLPPR
jgi:hypothetical protein